MSAPNKPSLGVNNILSFNGHGGKDSGKSFTLDLKSNVYILVPFGLDVELPTGSNPSKTDTTFKGLDVCYTSFSPGAGSFEEIIYDKDGKLKLVFNDKKSPSSQNVDAKWHLYKPGDVVPNVNYFAWKKGDTAAPDTKTCNQVSDEYDPFISTIMKECLNLGDEKLNKKVCAYFVSDSKKTTTTSSDGKTTSAVFIDKEKNYHLKLKICGSGDDTTPTTTLEELANNCRELVDFSKDVVKKSKASPDSVYAGGYADDKIFPKSGKDDPIILMPFTCNSCDETTDIPLINYTSDLKDVATLSEIINNLVPITLEEQTSIFDYDKSPELNISNYISVINTIYESTKTKPTKKSSDGSITSDYHDVLPSGSASIVNLDKLSTGKPDKSLFINEDNNIKFILQAASGSSDKNDLPIYGADGLTNSVYNCLYLANKNTIKGIAFPIIGGAIFFNTLKITKNKLYELLLQGVANYFKDFSDSQIEIVLFAQPNKDDDASNDNFEKVFTTFLLSNPSVNTKLKKQKNTNVKDPNNPDDKTDDLDASVFAVSKIYNSELSNHTKITALVNAANTELTFGDGLSKAFKREIDSVYINGISDKINKDSNALIKKFHKAYDEYVKSLTGSSSPPATPPAKSAPSKPLNQVIKELIVSIEVDEDKEATLLALKIQEPLGDLVYKYTPHGDGSSQEDKNLNSAEPTIDVMIKGFESAETGDDKNFYLGACQSIQAAYELEKTEAGSNNDKKMRAKLLLNLRKNSLLLKVPAWWDYATMKMGEAPELTEEEVKAKYDILQQECAKLTGGYESEDAYKLTEKLIPLNVEMENNDLEEKNKIVQTDYPTTEITYAPVIKIEPGYTKIVTQLSLNCGRAALVNFFGVPDLLVKGSPLKTKEIFDLNKPRPNTQINMGSICNLRAKYAKLFKIYDRFSDECPDAENYSINVLNVVLQILGYQSGQHIVFNGNSSDASKNNHDEANKTASDKNTLGYLVNTNKTHWICYKKVNLNKSEDLFYRINSLPETNEDAVSKTTYSIKELIDMDGGNNDNQYLSIYPINILTSLATNQDLFIDFTGAKSKDFYINQIKDNKTNYQWKLFMKEIVSKIITENKSYDPEENRIKIMAYFSNMPIDIITNDEKKKILDSFKNPSTKNQIIDKFIEMLKEYMSGSFTNFQIDYTKDKAYIKKEEGTYKPTDIAEKRFFYNLNNNTSYNNKVFKPNYKTQTFQLGEIYIKKIAKEALDALASPGGGGFKPRHNAITNHAKSRHNSSFKASSSSKSKGKSHNRSHTQRIK